MTTYQSDGQQLATGVPFTEVGTAAGGRADLLAELWSALPPQLRIAAAVFTPDDPAGAEIRHADDGSARTAV